MINAEVDMTKFNKVLAGLSDALMGSASDKDRSDAATITRDEAGRLARQIMHTAPPSRKTETQSNKADRQRGEKAIANDLRKLIGVADADTIAKFTTVQGRSDIDGWLAMDDGSTIHVVWDYAASSEGELGQIHQRYRNARGRVSRYRRGFRGKWFRTVITTPALRNKYIRKVQKKVGILKASWAACAIAIMKGAKSRDIPKWVSDHVPSPHSFYNVTGLEDHLHPGVTFGSRAPGNSRIQKSMIKNAVRARMHAMQERTMLVLSGYAKDVRNGMKPKRRAKQYAGT